MFDLCIRNSKSVLNYFVSYELHGTGCSVQRIFPEDVPNGYIVRIHEFGFFCCSDRKPGERFVLVFTDAGGNLEFVYCYRPSEKLVFCISSALPWFACFHGILDILWFNELYSDSRWYLLHSWLTRLLAAEPPTEQIDYFMCPDPFRSVRCVKFKIPNAFTPHNSKYLMEYYNALDFSLWIHIFVRLILERSVLFYSSRLPRLTSCVLTAVSLLHPLHWAHPLYPVIPQKLVEVLGCPAPFVAGIHACNLQAALEHVGPDTCVVNLDAGTVELPPATGQATANSASLTLTPKAVFDYLRCLLKDARREFTAAFSANNPKSTEWKKVDGETCRFFEHLANPFFFLLLNLFGGYKECLARNGESLEVNIDLLVAQQNCPDLEPFLYTLCDTQAVQMFLDSLVRMPPDPSTVAFDAACHKMTSSTGKAKVNRKMSRSTRTSSHLNKPLPLAEALNGSAASATATTHSSDSLTDQSLIQAAAKQWAQSKKIRSPGELCSWDYDSNLTESRTTRSLGSSSFTHLNQKFLQLRSQAATLRNLSRTKDTPVTISPLVSTASVDDSSIRSRSSSTLPGSTRPYSTLNRSSTTRLHELAPMSRDALDKAESATGRLTTTQSPIVQSSRPPQLKQRPPRPPPPRIAVRTNSMTQPTVRNFSSSVTDRPLIVPSPPESSQIPFGPRDCSPAQVSPTTYQPSSVLYESGSLRPPPLPPRPAWLMSLDRTTHSSNKPLLKSRGPNEYGSMKPINTALSSISRVSRDPGDALQKPIYQRPYKSTTQTQQVSGEFSTSPPNPMPLSPTGDLFLRRRSRLTDSSLTLESSEASLRDSEFQRHSSKGDNSTISRTSSDSHGQTETVDNRGENRRQSRWLPIGDTTTPWLTNNIKHKPNGVDCSPKRGLRRCATLSHMSVLPKHVAPDTEKTSSCKSLIDL